MTQAAPDKPQPHVPDYEFWREPEPDQPIDNTRLDMRVTGFPETLADALPRDEPPITVRRGGTPWPIKPTLKDAFERFEEEARREGRWIAPTDTLGLDGKPLVEPAPEHPLLPGTWVKAILKVPTEADSKELPAWASELQYWWTSTASSDIGGSIQKIVNYGGRGAAYDLIATGHDLAALNGRTVGDEEAAELAVVFYLSSKINRMLAAAIDGRRGSDDTALDITFYSLILRRIRAAGGWPVRNDKEPTT